MTEASPLLYLGTALSVGSVIFGIVAGLIHVGRKNIQQFKYGEFYSVFALVGSIGLCLASIAFYFNFLGPHLIPLFCSFISLASIAGLIVLSIFVKKDNRILFVVLSFYAPLTIWLAPLFLWNIIYLLFFARRKPTQPRPM